MNTTSRQRPSQAASPLALFAQSVFLQYLWLAVYACAVCGGCSPKKAADDPLYRSTTPQEVGAAAEETRDTKRINGKLDATTDQSPEDVQKLNEQLNRIIPLNKSCCHEGCPCDHDELGNCPCTVTGEPCGPDCPCADKKIAKPARDWREVYSAGRWWYYQPDKTWLIWDGKRWVKWKEHKPTAGQRQGGKTNWFGEPKVIRPWRNGLFMGADVGQSGAANCFT